MASMNANNCDLSAATQAMAGLSVETPSDTNTVPTFHGDTDIPADEMTLSIDHIREQLFSLLTPKHLFKCRRLNRVWNSYATVELQDRFEVKCTIKGETLEEYLNLLQKHQEMFPSLPLPSFRKYSFKKDTLNILSDPTLQQFLRTYGHFIYDLSLMQDWQTCSSIVVVPKEKDVMDHVRSLLIHSAPNLSSLRMDNIAFVVVLKKRSSDLDQEPRHTLCTTDPEFEEIHSIPDTDKNENLKFFSFNTISGKIFELAIQLAPNLEEIQVRSNDEYGDENHEYFLEPLNRLRFLKGIQYNTDSSKLFKKFADLAQEGNLKLRNISFMFGMEYHKSRIDLYPPFGDSYDDEDLDAINKLLACSWDSLETIEWRWVIGAPGLKWPEVMPTVSRLKLGPYKYNPVSNGLLAFLPNFVSSKTFPKLRHVEICEVVDSRGFTQLLRCFHGQRLDSVEEVSVFDFTPEERDATTLANLEQVRRLFPSAQILPTWPFTFGDSESDTDGEYSE